MNINTIIQNITPLYNEYKKNSKNISGTESLIKMWDIGDILKNFIQENKISPHTLFRKIYGKSESKKDIVQKSYITREFQTRCYRIRNIFLSKEEIIKTFPSLKSFSAFRESMPFFDNKKYKLEGEEKEKLLKTLNSLQENKFIMQKIYKLQKEKIGIKNPRTQRLQDLEKEKKIFIDFYNLTYHLLQKSSEEIKIILHKNSIEKQYIRILAQNTNALSQDGLKFTPFSSMNNVKYPLWKEYENTINYFSSHTKAIEKRRFRRLILPERIVKLADMLYELYSIK
jgi:hypothetical protein